LPLAKNCLPPTGTILIKKGDLMRRAFRNPFRFSKSKASDVSIIRVLSITSGGSHAWCESSVGSVRKPIAAIPKSLMDEYRNGR